MWRLCRKTIFTRWHVSRQYPSENNKNSTNIVPLSDEKNSHEENQKKKQHAHEHEKKCWDDRQFHCYFFNTSLLETAGFLGTAVGLCLNLHHRHFNNLYHYDEFRSSCLFSKLVHAMPQISNVLHKNKETFLNQASSSFNVLSNKNISTKQTESSSDTETFLNDFDKMLIQYAANIQNISGVKNVKLNSRKAFRYFLGAAEYGSNQAFFNLGLCYELGKGTKINLQKAADYYRKAAMNGHGLASFNLAIFFLKGLGNLPIDKETAKLLILEAANKEVPEAQIYLGLEYLEEEMWEEAFEMFTHLANKNIPDGKYYLGLCYENGWGIVKNEKLAADLFSQAATQGHIKAILQLGHYYEEGLGGCDQDKDFAKALFQLLADKGETAGKRALMLLELKQKKSFFKVQLKMKKNANQENKATMRTSASVPELNDHNNIKYNNNKTQNTPSYLHLILPFINLENNRSFNYQKPQIYSKDEMKKCSNLNLNNSLIPYFHNMPKPLTMRT